MEINKKNRTELKSFFVANNIPTQQNFEDFIEANLNQAEDGIAKMDGGPIALEAEGDSGGPEEALNLFRSFTDNNPAWGINLNPRVDPSVPTSNQPGLNIKDATGASRLFIRSAGGQVGLGTIEPTASLTIKAETNAPQISVISSTDGDANVFEVAQKGNCGLVSVNNKFGEPRVQLTGALATPSFFLNKVGIGTKTPETILHVEGPGAEVLISNNKNGLIPRLRFQHLDGDFWHITSRGHALDFIPKGEQGKKFVIGENGNVRISGSGKEDTPDGFMYINNRSILFGGEGNDGENKHSATISAGKHVPNSLNIVGMSTGGSSTNRKVDVWAEGGMTVRGHIKSPTKYVVAFSVALSAHTSGTRNPLTFGQTNYNIGGHWKNKNTFHAPVDGIYLFTMHMRNNTDSDVAWNLRLNGSGFVNGASGSELAERAYVRSRLDQHSASRTVITSLKAGDTVHVAQGGGGNDNYSSGFEGVLLIPLA